ncbi:hypothetical protein P154DRAFT_526601 [Amniculicola lignicola CBS 123094]|uniref:Uncharacterized protein n=1 Tax=Amniculicola lignicola CBS 123094 TaxID=1392246 RepID=A0A6A5W019_9PLEO|nr:hypothetical protein P154DRAFT_526601 [Amniculicola lignicola CBS 123094]
MSFGISKCHQRRFIRAFESHGFSKLRTHALDTGGFSGNAAFFNCPATTHLRMGASGSYTLKINKLTNHFHFSTMDSLYIHDTGISLHQLVATLSRCSSLRNLSCRWGENGLCLGRNRCDFYALYNALLMSSKSLKSIRLMAYKIYHYCSDVTRAQELGPLLPIGHFANFPLLEDLTLEATFLLGISYGSSTSDDNNTTPTKSFSYPGLSNRLPMSLKRLVLLASTVDNLHGDVRRVDLSDNSGDLFELAINCALLPQLQEVQLYTTNECPDLEDRFISQGVSFSVTPHPDTAEKWDAIY